MPYCHLTIDDSGEFGGRNQQIQEALQLVHELGTHAAGVFVQEVLMLKSHLKVDGSLDHLQVDKSKCFINLKILLLQFLLFDNIHDSYMFYNSTFIVVGVFLVELAKQHVEGRREVKVMHIVACFYGVYTEESLDRKI